MAKREVKTEKVTVINVYAVLGTHAQMTDDEIRTEYYRKARVAHPDKGGSADAFAPLALAYAATRTAAARATWAAAAALVGQPCDQCSATGATRRQRGFAAVVLATCTRCGGGGFIL